MAENVNNNSIFQNPTVILTANIQIGQTESSILNLGFDIAGRGAAQIRRINFPVSWTTSNVSFLVSEQSSFTDAFVLWASDGSDASALNIPNVTGGGAYGVSVPVQAPFFDTLNYVKIVSSLPQVSTVQIQVVTAPIYELQA